MLKLVKFLNTLNPTYRAETKALAGQSLNRLTAIRSDFHMTAPTLRGHLRSELRFKRALARIDAKLSSLTIVVGQNNSLLMLARVCRWTQRKAACEKALNIVRRKINKARNNWAILEAETQAIISQLQSRLTGSSSTWAKTLRSHATSMRQEISEQRRWIANLMTKSALVHNGRTKVSHTPDLLRRLDMLGAQISA